MYVNMNGILAAQRPGRTAGRAPGRRPLLSSGAAEACALARPGVSLSRFLARVSRSLRTPLRLPVRGCGPYGSWRAWRRWVLCGWPGF